MEHSTILIVDDSTINLRVASRFLEKAGGYQTLTTTSGLQALELVREERPDLILLDVMMPELNGFEVCQQLKSDSESAEIPIIFLTVKSKDEDVIRGFQVGGADFISKPFRKEILLARVETQLSLYKKTRKMKALSNTDALTGLPNRAAFEAHLERRVEQSHQNPEENFALLFIDLDRFKPVNDELGHEVGDLLLKAVAQRLKDNLRQIDLAARIGGDEFVVLIHVKVTPERIKVIAEKLVAVLCDPFQIGKHQVQIGASIGSALYPEDAESGEVLVQHADIAMYAAKESGRNTHVAYSRALSARITAQQKLEQELDRAIEEDQFLLYFQPRKWLSTGQVVGVEALLRWDHPQRGRLMPAEFIEVLMRGERGVRAEWWIFRAVCKQIKAWSEAHGHAVPVSINLSENQFHQPDLDQQILNIVDEIGLPEGALGMVELEIEEEVLMTAPDFSPLQLEKLDRLGIRITMDNFGTGRSSLALLKKLPFTSVKLSLRLIDECREGEVRSFLQFAILVIHELGYTAVAEGVETEQQLQLLKEAGCDSGIGYHLGHPVDENNLTELMN